MRSRTGAKGAGFFVQGDGCVQGEYVQGECAQLECVQGAGCVQGMKMCAESGNGAVVMGSAHTNPKNHP